jgi:hypothetical protein
LCINLHCGHSQNGSDPRNPALKNEASIVNKADSNRQNAKRSTGPHDTQATRLNAVKHGLLAKGITQLDDSDAYEALLQRLMQSYRPVGDVESFLVQRIAFGIIRLQRAARLEAEYITEELQPGTKQSLEEVLQLVVVEPGHAAAVSALGAINLVSGFQRYETAIENKLYRAINHLERTQRARNGEYIAPPESIDVALHTPSEAEP